MEPSQVNEEEDGLQPFFNSPFLTFVKSLTMFVGELEFSDIPIDRSSNLMPLSYLYFLSFVLLIVVVLMNLLNGLAVSDIRYQVLLKIKIEVCSQRNTGESNHSCLPLNCGHDILR